MERDDRARVDEGQVIGLVVEVLDDEAAGWAEVATSAAGDHRTAELSLADVVAAGRAAYCWLDVIATLRNVTRHRGTSPKPRPVRSPAADWAAPPTG